MLTYIYFEVKGWVTLSHYQLSLRIDERKNKNYIPLGINAGGITSNINEPRLRGFATR